MAYYLQNGGTVTDPHLNGGVLDDSSRYQLAGIRVNGDGGTGTAHHHTIGGGLNGQHSTEPLYMNSYHLMNGNTSERDLQCVNDTISHLGLSPRPVSTIQSSATTSTTTAPATAPKPSKSTKHQQHQRMRSKSSGQMGYQYHVSENNNTDRGTSQGACSNGDFENRTLRFVGRRGLAAGGDDITSAKGTVRGVTNRVKAGIMNFTFKPLNQKQKAVNNDDERDKIIIYTTSMRIVRQTFEDCQFVRKLFQNHRVKYEERDLFMNAQHQQELRDRLEEDAQQVTLPMVFIDGELVGDVEKLEELNENGELRKILERFEKNVPTSDCSECGGFRYIPCLVCNGSKKSLHRNSFTDHFQALRCSHCDDNGLQKCTLCNK